MRSDEVATIKKVRKVGWVERKTTVNVQNNIILMLTFFKPAMDRWYSVHVSLVQEKIVENKRRLRF